jgi:hypothetical protein
LKEVPQFAAGGIFVRSSQVIDKPEGNNYLPPNPPLQAYGGEKLPLGIAPPDAKDDGPFRGKADFYAFRLGRYLIGMNRRADRSYELKTPAGFRSAVPLPISFPEKFSSTLSLSLPIPRSRCSCPTHWIPRRARLLHLP